ncbi:MAG: ABC transporter substrate-binding protein [Reyranellaceae bacterium]
MIGKTTRFSRRSLLAGAGALALPAGLAAPAEAQEKVVRFGISMADVPLTTGQPDRGAGAYKFTGYTLYDPLVAWEMDVSDRPGKLIPGLATDWKVDDNDKTLWTFKLRPAVKFHDGSAFDADAVIWNFDKVFDTKSPQFDQRQASQVRPRLPSVASYRKLDDMTVEVKTKAVDALFPYQMLWFLISSPAQFEKLGKDWNKVASEPSGTGPFKLIRLVPRERAELVRNDGYWNPKRLAKADRMILVVAPEPATRTAALLSGTVDLIETPPPDAVERLTKGGMKIVQNITPHVWNFHPSMLPGSPWTDIRLRKAANLAIDRDAIVQLLGGLAQPAYGQVDRTSPWFGKPTFELKYAPDEARKLMGAAGFSKSQPLKTRFVVASGGTGQMLSLPMNEAIQEMFKEIYIDLELKVVELEALYTAWRAGAKAEMNKDVTANNIAYVTSDPLYALTRFFHSNQAAPVGVNWSCYSNPDVDKLIDEALATFDPARQDGLMARVHEKVVDDAVLIWVVHDTNPHALSPKIKSYVQAQHWFQDLTTIGV